MEFSTLNGYKVKDKKAIRFYDTVDDMKNDETLKEGMYVKTKGYYSSNDGGHADYYIVNDSSLISDNGSIHNLSNGLKAKLINSDTNLDIKKFGLYCDGTHDDTTAFQNAIEYVRSKNIPLILSGLIKLTDTINISNTIIKGNVNYRYKYHNFDIWNDGTIKTYIQTGGTNLSEFIDYLKNNNLSGIISSSTNIFEYNPDTKFIIENVNIYGNLSITNQNGIARFTTPTDNYSSIRFKVDSCGFYFLNGNGLDLITLETSDILNCKFFWINNHAISVYNSDSTKDRPADYSNILNNYFHFIYNSAIYFYNTFRSSNNIVGNLFQYIGQYNPRMTFTFTDGLSHNTDVNSEADLTPCIEIKGTVNLSNNIIMHTKIEDNNGEQNPAFLSIDTTMGVNVISLKNNKIIRSSVLTKSYMYDLNCNLYQAYIERSQSNVNTQYYRLKRIDNNMSGTKQLLDAGGELMYSDNYEFNAKTISKYGYEARSKIYNSSSTTDQTITVNYSTLLSDFNITYPITDIKYLPIMFMISMHSSSSGDHSNKFGVFVLNVRYPSSGVMKYKGYSIFGDITLVFNEESMDITVPAYKITAITPVIITSGYPDYN